MKNLILLTLVVLFVLPNNVFAQWGEGEITIQVEYLGDSSFAIVTTTVVSNANGRVQLIQAPSLADMMSGGDTTIIMLELTPTVTELKDTVYEGTHFFMGEGHLWGQNVLNKIFTEVVEVVVPQKTTSMPGNPTEEGGGGFTIFPNPSAGAFSIEIAELTNPIVLDIYNVNGKKVSTHHIVQRTQIDMSAVPSGVYVAIVQGQRKHRRILVIQ